MQDNTPGILGTLTAIVMSAGITYAEQDHDMQISLLFVQTSKAIASDAQSFRLIEANDQTIYFSDRPNRIAGHIPLDRFVKGWSKGEDSFAANPPNAVVSVYETSLVENVTAVVELSAPVMDGSDLVYSYRIVDGAMPTRGGATSVFIDTFGPGGGVGAGFHGVGVGARGPGVTGWAGVAVKNCADGASC